MYNGNSRGAAIHRQELNSLPSDVCYCNSLRLAAIAGSLNRALCRACRAVAEDFCPCRLESAAADR